MEGGVIWPGSIKFACKSAHVLAATHVMQPAAACSLRPAAPFAALSAAPAARTHPSPLLRSMPAYLIMHGDCTCCAQTKQAKGTAVCSNARKSPLLPNSPEEKNQSHNTHRALPSPRACDGLASTGPFAKPTTGHQHHTRHLSTLHAALCPGRQSTSPVLRQRGPCPIP